ncbi:MAG: hypothetical protein AB7P21_23995 [Lautropia sp.]
MGNTRTGSGADRRPGNPPPDPASRGPADDADSPARAEPIVDWEDEGGSPPDVISSTDSEKPATRPDAQR